MASLNHKMKSGYLTTNFLLKCSLNLYLSELPYIFGKNQLTMHQNTKLIIASERHNGLYDPSASTSTSVTGYLRSQAYGEYILPLSFFYIFKKRDFGTNNVNWKDISKPPLKAEFFPQLCFVGYLCLRQNIVSNIGCMRNQ